MNTQDEQAQPSSHYTSGAWRGLNSMEKGEWGGRVIAALIGESVYWPDGELKGFTPTYLANMRAELADMIREAGPRELQAINRIARLVFFSANMPEFEEDRQAGIETREGKSQAAELEAMLYGMLAGKSHDQQHYLLDKLTEKAEDETARALLGQVLGDGWQFETGAGEQVGSNQGGR